jgi:hypothetical protein
MEPPLLSGMSLRSILLLALLLCGLSDPSPFIDRPVVSISDQAALAKVRTDLIVNMGYANGTLPTTLPAVTTNVDNPLSGSGVTMVSRVDRYSFAMSNGQTNSAYFYVSNVNNNGRNIILNPGHQRTCDWSALRPVHQIRQMLVDLLNAGYSVLAENMPNCGDPDAHNALFSTYADAMQYFVAPSVQAANYWDAQGGNGYYGIMGLSGGGWTTITVAAVDPRFKISVSIAGFLPGVHFPHCGYSTSDAEQSDADYYAIAGYLDQALMSGNGVGRRMLQILNIADDDCFGPAQWGYCESTYKQTWYQYTAAYRDELQSNPNGLQTSFDLVWDYSAVTHQISSFAAALAVKTFNDGLMVP